MRKPSLINSFLNTFSGLWFMLKSERNFQIEFCALLINLFLIFFFKLNTWETALIIIACFGVLAAEVFNTAIEKICDFIHPHFHKNIGIIKDIAASGVLLMTLAALIIGAIIYGKYVVALLNL